ncbi:hypothetical protein SK128_000564 [Halocaridina rubra]|uniref:Uncharacterized protein n=1 Tax=Halocaridina rubra TaxID=373956 RepID=A0AAN8WMC0_HALRR
MKVTLLLALVAAAVAMPAPEPEADPQLLLTHPLAYSYPTIKTIKVEDLPKPTLPLTYSYPYGLPLSYTYGLNYPLGYPYTYPFVVKAAEEPAAEE